MSDIPAGKLTAASKLQAIAEKFQTDIPGIDIESMTSEGQHSDWFHMVQPLLRNAFCLAFVFNLLRIKYKIIPR